MDQVTKDSIRHLQAYLPQERQAISDDKRKLKIREQDLENLSRTLEALLKTANEVVDSHTDLPRLDL